MKAVIVGTGIEKILDGAYKSIDTEYGTVEYLEKEGIIILPRHEKGHKKAPSNINYRANIFALHLLGVDEVIGFYAVGSITSRLLPGSYGLVEDFIDFSGRHLSFYDGEEGRPLKHTGMVGLYDRSLVTRFAKAAYRRGEKDIRSGIVYIMTNGPRLETPSEIRAFRNLGADVVGMTLASEAVLIKELGLKYCPVAFSINWAAGLDEEGVSFLEDETIEALSTRLTGIALEALR